MLVDSDAASATVDPSRHANRTASPAKRLARWRSWSPGAREFLCAILALAPVSVVGRPSPPPSFGPSEGSPGRGAGLLPGTGL